MTTSSLTFFKENKDKMCVPIVLSKCAEMGRIRIHGRLQRSLPVLQKRFGEIGLDERNPPPQLRRRRRQLRGQLPGSASNQSDRSRVERCCLTSGRIRIKTTRVAEEAAWRSGWRNLEDFEDRTVSVINRIGTQKTGGAKQNERMPNSHATHVS
ncbi:unnamed protein product [Caenorhabditis nigoni]